MVKHGQILIFPSGVPQGSGEVSGGKESGEVSGGGVESGSAMESLEWKAAPNSQWLKCLERRRMRRMKDSFQRLLCVQLACVLHYEQVLYI